MFDSSNLNYPSELPICSRRKEIIQLIKTHQVIVIAGETGSGKTTQIPKFCIEAGLGKKGRIACTQPRRIAAVSVASRIAEELGEELGRTVGYQIRFSEKTDRSTRIKLMTDGILLSEAQKDRNLYRYDAIIIDEAHERSLNIDFILGLVKRIIKKRKDLKVIITSATIDTQKFSKAFGDAPVIEVSGRTFPVDIQYRPISAETEGDGYVDQAVEETLNICSRGYSGDILIFMPTEQTIRETCDALESAGRADIEVYPLYARMPSSQQNNIFSERQKRKIIVATNIAETSITIPGITYVIDSGLARIASYSPATRTNALPITTISRSSADQRAGRCGRVSNGICIRLYSEEDYISRGQYTVPEILRSNLAEVLLRMIALKVSDIEHFPFIDPPGKRAIHDGLNLLIELGAIKKQTSGSKQTHYTLTKTGRFMAFMPLDPRISRILIEGSYQHCLREMTVLASVLSIQDPKERPLDKQKEADAAHKAFLDPQSDLISLLNIWDSYHNQWREVHSKSKMRVYCQNSFISYRRMREWRDIHLQLTSVLKEQGLSLSQTKLSKKANKKSGISPFYKAVHKSFLAGYLSNIAQRKEKQYYTGAKNKECMIFPGSGVFQDPPDWITAAEMVRTSRLFARNVAKIDPDWILHLAGSLKNFSYRSVHWSFSREEVVAIRQTRVYGLTVEGNKEVGYGEIDPAACGAVFNEVVLVENADRYKNRFSFLNHNYNIVQEIIGLENKLRRRDIFTGNNSLLDFYNKHLNGIFSIKGLQKFIDKNSDKALRIKKEDFMLYDPSKNEINLYPETGTIDGKEYSLVYNYSPEEKNDGVTIIVEEQDAAALNTQMMDWLVPGLLKEKVIHLIKALPKEYRRSLVPVNQSSEHLFERLPEKADKPLTDVLAELIYHEFDLHIPKDAWNTKDLPQHLSYVYEVRSVKGKPLRASRDSSILLKGSPSKTLYNEFSAMKKRYEKTKISEWTDNMLLKEIKGKNGYAVYPAFTPSETANDSVDLRLYSSQLEAENIHAKGIAVLAAYYLRDILSIFKNEILLPKTYAKKAMYFEGLTTLNNGIWHALVTEILAAPIFIRKEFLSYLEAVRGDVYPKMTEKRSAYINLVDTYVEVRATINNLINSSKGMEQKSAFLNERLIELRNLIPSNFYAEYEYSQLEDIVRYARCIEIRAQKGCLQLAKDKTNSEIIEPFYEWFDATMKNLAPYATQGKQQLLADFKWALEELKIQVFSQEIKTKIKVSPKRLSRMIEQIETLK